MKSSLRIIGTIILVIFLLAACGSEETTIETDSKEEPGNQSGETETRDITYLDETYTIPDEVERVVITGAMEAMEDAVALDVEPVGAITVAGEFPEVFKSVTGNAESIGEKQQPNFEKILQLDPDVILGSTKFPDEVVEKLEKIAPTILVSHISSDWEDNLQLMAELNKKEEEAKVLLTDYEEAISDLNASLSESFKDETVIAMRIRGGKMFIYPENVFFNPILYEELGLKVPDPIKKADAQEEISVEQLAELNPDHLFIQVQETGEEENEKAFEALKQNTIMQQMDAFKEDQVYVNMVDSLLEGSSVFSKTEFVKALQTSDNTK